MTANRPITSENDAHLLSLHDACAAAFAKNPPDQKVILESLVQLTNELRNQPEIPEYIKKYLHELGKNLENNNTVSEAIRNQANYLRHMTTPNLEASVEHKRRNDTDAKSDHAEHWEGIYRGLRNSYTDILQRETNPKRKEWLQDRIQRLEAQISTGSYNSIDCDLVNTRRPPYYEPDANTPQQLQINAMNAEDICHNFARSSGARLFEESDRLVFFSGSPFVPAFTVNTSTSAVTINSEFRDDIALAAEFVRTAFPEQTVDIRLRSGDMENVRQSLQTVGMDISRVNFIEAAKPDAARAYTAYAAANDLEDNTQNTPTAPSPPSPRMR